MDEVNHEGLYEFTRTYAGLRGTVLKGTRVNLFTKNSVSMTMNIYVNDMQGNFLGILDKNDIPDFLKKVHETLTPKVSKPKPKAIIQSGKLSFVEATRLIDYLEMRFGWTSFPDSHDDIRSTQHENFVKWVKAYADKNKVKINRWTEVLKEFKTAYKWSTQNIYDKDKPF